MAPLKFTFCPTVTELEATLAAAGLPPPDPRIFPELSLAGDPTGRRDDEAYGRALFEQLSALEAMLLASGAIQRMGTVADGTGARLVAAAREQADLVEVVADVEQRARENLASYGNKAMIIKGDVLELCRRIEPVPCFDVIYIDGGHLEHECLLDSCVCFRLLKSGGILFWDDVGGYESRTDWPGVGAALRSFLQAHNAHWRWLFHNHQAGIVKN